MTDTHGLRSDLEGFGGAERDRTAGLLVANEALSQLSYSPTTSLSYQRAENRGSDCPHFLRFWKGTDSHRAARDRDALFESRASHSLVTPSKLSLLPFPRTRIPLG